METGPGGEEERGGEAEGLEGGWKGGVGGRVKGGKLDNGRRCLSGGLG